MTAVKMEETASFPRRGISPPAGPVPERGLPSTELLLAAGGDDRITVNGRAANKYGCLPLPDPDLLAFGSSTATVVSPGGFAAAERLRRRLIIAGDREPAAVTYGRELDRIRRELAQLCGISSLSGLDIVFGASGTDLHMIAARLACAVAPKHTRAIVVEEAETGSGVTAAITGRHYSTRTPLGRPVVPGADFDGGGVSAVSVPIRRPDGELRDRASVDCEVEFQVMDAAAKGWHVLLILVDVSKTGVIAPSPACAAALSGRLPDSLHVLVDACQFRIAPPTIRAYLEHGFMVALTGSKFVCGPPFSGALLLPPERARRLRRCALSPALRAYSARADWPRHWSAAASLDNAANFGLLLRWEAALHELKALRSVPETCIASFLESFAGAVRQRIADDPLIEPLPVFPLERRPLSGAGSWDRMPTIFPFILYRSKVNGRKAALSRAETARVHEMLQMDLNLTAGHAVKHSMGELVDLRFQLGQPVVCGIRGGVPVSALRLCVGARLITAAASGNGRGGAAIINAAVAALDKSAMIAASLTT